MTIHRQGLSPACVGNEIMVRRISARNQKCKLKITLDKIGSYLFWQAGDSPPQSEKRLLIACRESDLRSPTGPVPSVCGSVPSTCEITVRRIFTKIKSINKGNFWRKWVLICCGRRGQSSLARGCLPRKTRKVFWSGK